MHPSKTITATIMATVLFLAGQAWGNACYSKAVSFQSVQHAKPSVITLESRRVKKIVGNAMVYDLGKEVIAIQTDSFASQRFLREVASGRCSARQAVTLEP